MNPAYTYLLINAGAIAIPLLLSFDKRVHFYRKWKAFWPANLLTLAFFIVWDALFTKMGIWGFNPTYLLGPHLLGLPLEEWLFFICVPYASVFLYETFRTYLPTGTFQSWNKAAQIVMIGISALLLILFYDRWYTGITALFTLIGLLVVWRTKPAWFGWFAFSYLIVLIPFTAANGLLTGLTFWEYPVLNRFPNDVSDMIVWYNNAHNIGIRLFSIPLDDTLYGFLLIGMNVALYEHFLGRYQRN